MVSFYCHNNRGNEYDRQVIKAARDTGIRLYFGRMNYDIISENAYEAKKKSQKAYYETPLEAEENFKELLSEASDRVEIAPSIHSIHASTREAVINAIKLGNSYNKIVQFHLSEDMGDVELSQKLYGLRPVEFLADICEKGIVDRLDNLMLSDCVWVDDNELRLIKKYNMKVVLNPRMNDRVKAGHARVRDMIEYGICPYLGTDGESSNDDLSITGERLFISSRYPDISEKLICRFSSVPLRFKNGYIGGIESGNFCDLKVTKNSKVYDVFAGGERVVKNGELLKLNIDRDIEDKLRESLKELFI
jgi:5-methylthioadenosine/S-adenosylhomocysteine deaminase